MHLLALLFAAAAAAPAPARAEAYPTAHGTYGVSFYAPATADSRLVGGSLFLADDVALRVDLGLNLPITPSGPGQNKLVTLVTALRVVGLKRHHVMVFLQPGVGVGRENSPAVSAEAAFFLRLSGGIGVEYLFTDWFSVGATLELSLKIANLGGPASTPIYTTVGTDTSTLSANIYF